MKIRVGVARSLIFFFFNDTATTEIYTLSLHVALPISATCGACTTSPATTPARASRSPCSDGASATRWRRTSEQGDLLARSEEHTSELQSQSNLVCRLLLEKKKPHLAVTHTRDNSERSA